LKRKEILPKTEFFTFDPLSQIKSNLKYSLKKNDLWETDREDDGGPSDVCLRFLQGGWASLLILVWFWGIHRQRYLFFSFTPPSARKECFDRSSDRRETRCAARAAAAGLGLQQRGGALC
jgi:hypothetical protein